MLLMKLFSHFLIFFDRSVLWKTERTFYWQKWPFFFSALTEMCFLCTFDDRSVLFPDENTQIVLVTLTFCEKNENFVVNVFQVVGLFSIIENDIIATFLEWFQTNFWKSAWNPQFYLKILQNSWLEKEGTLKL